MPTGKRNYIIKLFSASKPASVLVNLAKVKKIKSDALQANADSDFTNTSWSWDEAKGIIYVKFPASSTETAIEIKTN